MLEGPEPDDSDVRGDLRDAEAAHVFVQAAADYLGKSRLHVYQLLDAGLIESTRFGRRRLVKLSSLAAYAASLPVVLDVVPLPPLPRSRGTSDDDDDDD